MSLSKEMQMKIFEELKQRGAAERVCCDKPHYGLGNEIIRLDLQVNENVQTFGGPNLPVIPLVCSNCGNVSFHALNVLFPNQF